MIPHYRVVCAIIHQDDKILAVQRSEAMKLPLKWEFPGGKIEPNESEQQCIQREIKEELDIDIEVLQRLNPVLHDYPDFSIELIPYTAKHINGEIKLKEHAQYLLLDKSELQELDWAEADVPIVEEYLEV